MVQNLYNPANVSQAETISKLFKVAPIDTMTNGRCHTIHWEPLVKNECHCHLQKYSRLR